MIWDTSFYQGRYYYYWGPVPALVILPVKAILGASVEINDQYMLFFFCSGLVILVALILSRLRATFFASAPPWTLFPLILLGGLAMPVFWLINRPSVYETAIAGGQFFLFLGLYAALRCLTDRSPAMGWFFLAGLAWGAAFNCRLNLAIAVGFLSLILAWRMVKTLPSSRQKLTALVILATPLALWVSGMAWYNVARFGSILETGHRYQLTGPALPPNYSAVTSAAYILPSLYSYLVRPLQFLPREFPFVFAPFIKESMWPWWIRLPKYYYYPEPVAGLLTAIPAVWLSFLPMLGWLRRGWAWINERPAERDACAAQGWLWLWLAGSVLCLFAPLLVFISTSMRYLADVTPMVCLVAALGWWWGLRFWREQPAARRILSLAALGLILLSVGMSLLVNLTNGDKRFATGNPALYEAIARFFQ